MAGHCRGAPVQPPSYDTVVPSAPSECMLHNETKSDDVTRDLRSTSKTARASHVKFSDRPDGPGSAEHLNPAGICVYELCTSKCTAGA